MPLHVTLALLSCFIASAFFFFFGSQKNFVNQSFFAGQILCDIVWYLSYTPPLESTSVPISRCAYSIVQHKNSNRKLALNNNTYNQNIGQWYNGRWGKPVIFCCDTFVNSTHLQQPHSKRNPYICNSLQACDPIKRLRQSNYSRQKINPRRKKDLVGQFTCKIDTESQSAAHDRKLGQNVDNRTSIIVHLYHLCSYSSIMS